MKFSIFHPVTACIESALILSSNSSVASVASSSISLRGNYKSNHRIFQDTYSGTFLIAEIEYSDESATGPSNHGLRQVKNSNSNVDADSDRNGNNKKPRQTLDVQFADGTTYELRNSNIGRGWLNDKLKGMKSGVDKIKIPPGAIMSGSTIDLRGAEPENVPDNLFDRRDLQGIKEATRSPKQENNFAELRNRQLQIGDKTVLAVRVVAKAKDSAYTKSRGALRDDILGTNGDPVNLKSQCESCSFNQLKFMGGSNKSMKNNPDNASTNINNGVVTVEIPTSVNGVSQGTIKNAVINKLAHNFGTAQLADHVMLCLSPGTSGNWIAYAYINHWLSVYNNGWCNFVPGQMHEIGHNLGYGHSGDVNPYDDKTGLMGLSYTSDDGPKMCFNAAKSWQTGWYSAKSTRVDPSGGTNSVADCLEQDLYGIVGYENPEALTVLIKINDPSSSTDHYVAFNRKAGFNSGTKEAPDQVTVVKAGIEDGSYSESDLMAKLDAGQQYSYKTESGQNVAIITPTRIPGL